MTNQTLLDLLPFLLLGIRILAGICFLHALITRKDLYWILILALGTFFGGIFSTLAALIYTFQVLIPSLRGGGKAAGAAVARGVEAMKPLDVRIREARERLAESDTLQHRADMAALQARAGRPEEAQETLTPLLSGIYRDDPVVLLTAAELDLARSDFAAAEAKLSGDSLRGSATRTRALTLLAQAQAAQGKPEADATYREAMQGANTEEPRTRYAAYLIGAGRMDEARALLDIILKSESRASALYRRQEREWFQMAAALQRDLK